MMKHAIGYEIIRAYKLPTNNHYKFINDNLSHLKVLIEGATKIKIER